MRPLAEQIYHGLVGVDGSVLVLVLPRRRFPPQELVAEPIVESPGPGIVILDAEHRPR